MQLLLRAYGCCLWLAVAGSRVFAYVAGRAGCARCWQRYMQHMKALVVKMVVVYRGVRDRGCLAVLCRVLACVSAWC